MMMGDDVLQKRTSTHHSSEQKKVCCCFNELFLNLLAFCELQTRSTILDKNDFNPEGCERLSIPFTIYVLLFASRFPAFVWRLGCGCRMSIVFFDMDDEVLGASLWRETWNRSIWNSKIRRTILISSFKKPIQTTRRWHYRSTVLASTCDLWTTKWHPTIVLSVRPHAAFDNEEALRSREEQPRGKWWILVNLM